jgi:hypothetical protein
MLLTSPSLCRLLVCAAVLPLVGCGGSDDAESSSTTKLACTDFKAGQTIGDGVIVSATAVAASGPLPEHCDVRGTLAPKTTFAIRMPTQWNKRTVYVGGGGFNGNLAAPNAQYLTSGFAQMASTGGNDVPNTANFALDPLALNDYSYLSVHRTYQVGKEIVRSFYGENETKNYFNGCSKGGQEALIEAQRWPADFDGIVAMAPAIQLQSLFLGFTRNNKLIFAPGGNLTPAKLATLNQAILAACDAQDGASDGILSQPKLCTFNPAALRCTGADSDACLTDPQITTASSLYGTWSINGKQYLPGFYPGSEVAWNGTQTGAVTAATPRYSNLFADQYVRYFVTQDPAASAFTFDPVPWLPRITQLSLLSDSNDASLTAFRARGGKLILYHGLADSAISPKDTEAYYQAVVAAAGGQAEADKFVKAFFNPGVGHCSGGPGADTVDLLTPMVNWVESGIDPATSGITATKVAQGATVLSRPLCPYPQYPRYKGSGALTDAGNFVCTQP